MAERDAATLYTRWVFARAVCHRGYWLVASLYLVLDAGLAPLQLVVVGTAQGLTALAFEIPTGVLADTVSRKRSLVVAHALMAAAMIATGLVTAFPALVATQMLWGLSWTFSSGADVAWLTDELDRPERAPAVLVAGARWEQIGAAAGLLGFGALAFAVGRPAAIVAAGAAMGALGGFVAWRFGERGFTPAPARRLRASASILRRGAALAARDRPIRLVLIATVLVNGAAEGSERLLPKRLVDLGLPGAFDPIVWLTALGLATLALAAFALRIVESHLDGAGVARRVYAGACFVGAIGLGLLAGAPDAATGMAGALLVGGLAWSLTRSVGVIWVNRRTTSDVRATVQSFLGQAEFAGEISLGLLLGVLAQASAIAWAMAAAGGLLAGTGALVAWGGRDDRDADGSLDFVVDAAVDAAVDVDPDR